MSEILKPTSAAAAKWQDDFLLTALGARRAPVVVVKEMKKVRGSATLDNPNESRYVFHRRV